MGAAGDLRPHNGRVRLKQISEQLFQSVPAHIVIAVARGGRKVTRGDRMAFVQVKDFSGIAQLPLIQGGKLRLQLPLGAGDQGVYLVVVQGNIPPKA